MHASVPLGLAVAVSDSEHLGTPYRSRASARWVQCMTWHGVPHVTLVPPLCWQASSFHLQPERGQPSHQIWVSPAAAVRDTRQSLCSQVSELPHRIHSGQRSRECGAAADKPKVPKRPLSWSPSRLCPKLVRSSSMPAGHSFVSKGWRLMSVVCWWCLPLRVGATHCPSLTTRMRSSTPS